MEVLLIFGIATVYALLYIHKEGRHVLDGCENMIINKAQFAWQ